MLVIFLSIINDKEMRLNVEPIQINCSIINKAYIKNLLIE
jgi:hypothetical protein